MKRFEKELERIMRREAIKEFLDAFIGNYMIVMMYGLIISSIFIIALLPAACCVEIHDQYVAKKTIADCYEGIEVSSYSRNEYKDKDGNLYLFDGVHKEMKKIGDIK